MSRYVGKHRPDTAQENANRWLIDQEYAWLFGQRSATEMTGILVFETPEVKEAR